MELAAGCSIKAAGRSLPAFGIDGLGRVASSIEVACSGPAASSTEVACFGQVASGIVAAFVGFGAGTDPGSMETSSTAMASSAAINTFAAVTKPCQADRNAAVAEGNSLAARSAACKRAITGRMGATNH